MFFESSFPQYDVEYVTRQLVTFEMKGIFSRISKGVLMRDLVQALRSIGENNITADDEKQNPKLLAENPERATMEHDLLLAPVWMRNIIRRNFKNVFARLQTNYNYKYKYGLLISFPVRMFHLHAHQCPLRGTLSSACKMGKQAV